VEVAVMADSSVQSRDVDQLVHSLQGALQELAPADEIAIRDFEGKEYVLSTVLPARRQVQVFRALGRVLETGQASLADGELSGAGILKLLVHLITNEAVVEQLGGAFTIAYPTVLGEHDPLDVFPIEEIVAALAPLLLRLVRRAGSLIAGA
jgi:hypothetical protein